MFTAASAIQEAPSPKKSTDDTFFSGTVAEFDDKKLIVVRTVLGKAERRTFLIDSSTKIEGKLRQKVRVTVKFEVGESGDCAKLVRVRSATPAKKK